MRTRTLLYFVPILMIHSAAAQAPEFSEKAPIIKVEPSKGFPYKPTELHNYVLPPEEFKKRRAAFVEEIAKYGPGTIAIVKSAPVFPRNGDVEHEYRQDSDFYWLTGFHESESMAIFDPDAADAASDAKIDTNNTKKRAVYSLMMLPRDPARETWTGKRVGPERALSDFGVDAAFTNDQSDKLLKDAVARAKTLVIINNFDKDFSRKIDTLLNETRARTGESPRIVNAGKWIGEQRLIKSPAEIEIMKRAIEVTIEGHFAAMRAARPGMNEGEVEAACEFVFRALGGPRLGYPSIAGGGNNGCVLHYNTNNEWLGPNSLMLLDAGTEIGYYTSDITRTWPVNGKFTPEQRAIYNIVLRAQNAGIDKCRPGVVFSEVNDAAVREVTKGLIEVGILEGDLEELIKKGAHRKVFMHGTSHWLGLDVHDSGSTKGRKFEPGMILTVEPGIYIAEGTPNIDKKWWGIGVRIEDDILITENGPLNLSERLPRDVETIEKIVQEAHARTEK
ncbi:MAG: aminopeptidase P N-terminal domain-containing protein [Planctomycetota bacterium]